MKNNRSKKRLNDIIANKAVKLNQNKIKEEEAKLIRERHIIDVERNLLNDTIHELRTINNQIKSISNKIHQSVNQLEIDDNFLINSVKTLESNASLLSIRMDLYDLIHNPNSADEDPAVYIGIYNKIEKVYKCLYHKKRDKNIVVNLKGNTVKEYKLHNSIELAFFILIDNAIKYSPNDNDIDIIFKENGSKLSVTFKNLGLELYEEDKPHIFERGFRGSNIKRIKTIKGNGLGLYLFKQICESNNVKYRIDSAGKEKVIEGLIYKPFVVELQFE